MIDYAVSAPVSVVHGFLILFIIYERKREILWKKVEDSQQMAHFNKLSYGSLWKNIILEN